MNYWRPSKEAALRSMMKGINGGGGRPTLISRGNNNNRGGDDMCRTATTFDKLTRTPDDHNRGDD